MSKFLSCGLLPSGQRSERPLAALDPIGEEYYDAANRMKCEARGQEEFRMTIDDPRRKFFDDLAARWDEQEPSERTMTERLAEHADLLALAGGQRLLEVGCGAGKTTAWLAARVAPGRVTAIDFSPEMIAKARSKGIDADFACMDVCSDDLGAGRYDVILCFHSFPHFRDQPAALRSFRRALKPGGRLIVMHLAGSEQINRFHAGIDGPVNGDVLLAGAEWGALLSAAGLEQHSLIDREDLFFLSASAAAGGA